MHERDFDLRPLFERGGRTLTELESELEMTRFDAVCRSNRPFTCVRTRFCLAAGPTSWRAASGPSARPRCRISVKRPGRPRVECADAFVAARTGMASV